MINAKDAHLLTVASEDYANAQEFAIIEDTVIKCARLRQYECYIPYSLTPAVQHELRSHGYKVKRRRGVSGYDIRW